MSETPWAEMPENEKFAYLHFFAKGIFEQYQMETSSRVMTVFDFVTIQEALGENGPNEAEFIVFKPEKEKDIGIGILSSLEISHDPEIDALIIRLNTQRPSHQGSNYIPASFVGKLYQDKIETTDYMQFDPNKNFELLPQTDSNLLDFCHKCLTKYKSLKESNLIPAIQGKCS